MSHEILDTLYLGGFIQYMLVVRAHVHQSLRNNNDKINKNVEVHDFFGNYLFFVAVNRGNCTFICTLFSSGSHLPIKLMLCTHNQ